MFGHQKVLHYVRAGATGLGLALAICAGARAADVSVECQLLYEITDGIYVTGGRGANIQPGGMGWIEFRGRQVARVEVVSVSKDSTFLRILGPRTQDLPLPGGQLTLVLTGTKPVEEPKARQPSPTLKDRNAADDPAAALSQGAVQAPAIPDNSKPGQLPPPPVEGTTASEAPAEPKPAPEAPKRPLVPLLSPDGTKIGAFTDAYNISQGQISVRQLLQLSPGNELNYAETHIRSSGSVERIEATPWAFEWSGDLIYRDGNALENTHDFQEPDLELYRLSFYRKFDDQSWVRLGRFLPRELPSVGYMDGVQGEWVLNEHWRVGGVFGLKPLRNGLDFSVNEPTTVGYLTYDTSDGGGYSYTGTWGLLSSLYHGHFDRLSLLADQTLRLNKLTVYSSSELDFDVGSAEVHDGIHLTRWDLLATYPIWSHTTLRAGIDRYDLPDTAAERDAVPALVLNDFEFFDNGYWRYWAGASHQLPWNLTLAEEVGVTDSDVDDWSLRWNASLTRIGLPLLPPGSSLTLTGYNLDGPDIEGYGGRLSGYIPISGGRLSLQPAVAFRYLTSNLLGKDEFTFTDASLHAQWTINKSWSMLGGVSYAFTDDPDIQRLFFDVGLTFRW